MLEAALALARKGFRVFPTYPGAKNPAGGKGWQERATADPLAICDLWAANPNYNPAIFTRGFVVIDADTYKGASLEKFRALGPLPETFTVQTARGGVHFYFESDEDFSNSPGALPEHFDVRGHGGLVLGPGAVFEGGNYTALNDVPPAPLPSWLASTLRRAEARLADAGTTIGDVDTPEMLARCTAWLEAAPDVFEGGRDNAGFQVACKFYDYGVSQAKCLELLHEWNDAKVFPPLEDADLERLSASGINSRRDAIGRDNPRAGLEPIEHPPRGSSAFQRSIVVYDDTPEDLAAIPPRPWLARRHLLRGKVTTLVAPGSAGKSLLMQEWGAALALGPVEGGTFCGLDVCERANVLIINAEDDTAEMRMRLGGVIQEFGLPRDDVRRRVYLQSSQDPGAPTFRIAERDRKTNSVRETPMVADLIDFIREKEISAVIVDPFVDTHGADENSNGEVNSVMRIYRRIASETNVALVLVHHTKKPSAASSESYAGNADSARGAGAIINASRIAVTLYPMSEKDGEKFGVEKWKRHRYVRLDDAKTNLTLASPDAQWFEKRTVELPNGELVGALAPVNLAAKTETDGRAVLEALAPLCEAGEVISVEAAVTRLRERGGFMDRSPASVRDLVSGGLAIRMPVAGGLSFVLEGKGKTGGKIHIKAN